MLDENQFRRLSDQAIDTLKQALIRAEGDSDFETEENAGALHILFEEPPAKFVVTPNTPVRQIWISALSTSFKLEWSDEQQQFLLPRTGETLLPLTARLISQHLGTESSPKALHLG
jgi:iron donor protein CyaY